MTDSGPKTICVINIIFGYHIAYRVVSYESKQLFYVDDNVRTRIYCRNHDLDKFKYFTYLHRLVLALHKLFLNVQMTQSVGARYNDGIFVLHKSTKYNGTIPTLLSSVNVSRLFVKGFF